MWQILIYMLDEFAMSAQALAEQQRYRRGRQPRCIPIVANQQSVARSRCRAWSAILDQTGSRLEGSESSPVIHRPEFAAKLSICRSGVPRQDSSGNKALVDQCLPYPGFYKTQILANNLTDAPEASWAIQRAASQPAAGMYDRPTEYSSFMNDRKRLRDPEKVCDLLTSTLSITVEL